MLPGLALRLAVAAALLAVAFRVALGGRPGAFGLLRESFVAPAGETLLWMAAACAILGATYGAATARFRTLLRGAGIEASFGALLRAYLIAAFFNLVMPGGLAGDAWRVWDVRRDTGQGSAALGIVAAERLVSLAALVVIALSAVSWVPLRPEYGWARRAVAGTGGACLAAGLVALRPTGIGLLRAVLARTPWLPGRAREVAGRALGALEALACRPREVAAAFGWSLVTLGGTVLAVYALAVPLGAPVALPWFLAIVPFSALLEMLPVTIGGTGVREMTYVTLFGAVGMRREVALALSLSVLGASLVWGAVGLGIFLARRRRSA